MKKPNIAPENMDQLKDVLNDFTSLCSDRFEVDGAKVFMPVIDGLSEMMRALSFSRMYTSDGTRKIDEIIVEAVKGPERVIFISASSNTDSLEKSTAIWLTLEDVKDLVARLNTAIATMEA